MKKFKLTFPISKADSFADFAFANEVHIQLAYTKGAELFSNEKVICHCYVKDENVSKVEASEWKQYLIN